MLVCCGVVSVPCSLAVTCWERADLLAVVCVVFTFLCCVTFPNVSWSTYEWRARLAPRNWFKPSSKIFLLTVPRRYFFCGLFLLCMSCVCHAFASVYCCHVMTCWEKADLLALVCDVYCVFVTFPCGIMGQVRYLIVSIPDLCHLSYFVQSLVFGKAWTDIFAGS